MIYVDDLLQAINWQVYSYLVGITSIPNPTGYTSFSIQSAPTERNYKHHSTYVSTKRSFGRWSAFALLCSEFR